MLKINIFNEKKLKSLLVGGVLAITLTGCGLQSVSTNQNFQDYEKTRSSYDTTSSRIEMVDTGSGYHLADVYRLDEVEKYFKDGSDIVKTYSKEGIDPDKVTVYIDALTGEIISVEYQIVEHVTFTDHTTGEVVEYDKKYLTFEIAPVLDKEDIADSVRLNCEDTTISREEATWLTNDYNGEVDVKIPQANN